MSSPYVDPFDLDRHNELIAAEVAAAGEDGEGSARANAVMTRVGGWETKKEMEGRLGLRRGEDAIASVTSELVQFSSLPWPEYYLMPFHSVPGGWLSAFAAVFNRTAMEAIYRDAHPQKSIGIRRDLAALVPSSSKLVVEFGAGDCDGAAAVARRLSAARIVALDASPYMLIVGRRQNSDVGNLEVCHALAEEPPFAQGSVDCVTITLVLHECSDEGKRAIVEAAFRVLRPGGTLILTDTPTNDLDTYRGFCEPYRPLWARFDPDALLAEVGFVGVSAHQVAPPAFLWTRVARKPGGIQLFSARATDAELNEAREIAKRDEGSVPLATARKAQAERDGRIPRTQGRPKL